MSHEPMLVRLSDMEPNQSGDCFVLLGTKERAKTRDGKPYYRLSFQDSGRKVTAMVWSDTGWFADCEAKWQEGAFFKIRCQYIENQYGPQVELDRIRDVTDADTADGFEPAEFFASSRFHPDEMFAELVALAEEHISQLPLKDLVLAILHNNEETLKLATAAVRNHHAFRGGYLEHVLSVTRTCVFLADKYQTYYPDLQPPLSKSLVVAGGILHDVGKIRELDFQPHGAAYTPSGRLIGHILLGRDIVRDAVQEIDGLDEETVLRLEHIIVSHQNLPEWGSPVAPHTPEALLVHYADDIDAKYEMMAAVLNQPPEDDEPFSTSRNPLRRRIFRGLQDAPE